MPLIPGPHGRVYYESHGQGNVLVLLHGMWSNMGAWRRMIPALSAGHRVILLDQIGHGKSDPMQTPYRLNTHARDLDCLMDLLELEAATLVGFSMGAQIAQEYSFLRPSRVKGLVLIATPPPYRFRWRAGIEFVSMLERLGITSLKKETIKALKRRYAKNRDPEFIEKSLKELSGYSDQEFALVLRSVWEEKNLHREGSIRIPTLLLVGEKDGIKDHSIYMHRVIPNARFLVIPDGDHSVLFLQYAFLAESVLEFQQGLE